MRDSRQADGDPVWRVVVAAPAVCTTAYGDDECGHRRCGQPCRRIRTLRARPPRDGSSSRFDVLRPEFADAYAAGWRGRKRPNPMHRDRCRAFLQHAHVTRWQRLVMTARWSRDTGGVARLAVDTDAVGRLAVDTGGSVRRTTSWSWRSTRRSGRRRTTCWVREPSSPCTCSHRGTCVSERSTSAALPS